MVVYSGPPGGDVQGRRIPGFGRCIYCGGDGDGKGLGEEHVIPLSLNGNVIIDSASCRCCEQRINQADTHLARAVFYNYRLVTNARTRNPKNRPTTRTVDVEFLGERRAFELPSDQAPFSTAMPVWGEPGIIRGAAIDAPFPDVREHHYHWYTDDIGEKLGLKPGDEFKLWSATISRADLLARAVAKIAYCHLVIRFGLDGFRKLALPDVILGKCPAIPYFVGASMEVPPPPLGPGTMHAVEVLDITIPKNLRVYLVSVRLYASAGYQNIGMPIYKVIAGAPKIIPTCLDNDSRAGLYDRPKR
jgi:hypothetical protein